MNHLSKGIEGGKNRARALDDETLASTWHDAWGSLGCMAPERIRTALMAAWSEGHRHYHDQRHLRECMSYWKRWQALAQRPGEVALAIWFHDAVYDAKRTDNEIESASWAARSLAECGVSSESAQRVHDLVMATAHDARVDTGSGPDMQLLVDIDLSILGASDDRFDEYDEDVAKEYAWVRPAEYREGRAKVLRKFLGMEPLYKTAAARDMLEEAARLNLTRALARLGASRDSR